MADTTAPCEADASTPREGSKPRERTVRFVAVAAVGGSALLALFFVAEFIWIASHRARFGFDLEWMEGALVDHVERVLSGASLYVPPSVDFVPLIYAPFYYLVCAPFAKLFGIDYFALRLVSVLSTLASFGLIFAIVYREARLGGRRAVEAALPAIVGAGFYAGTFALSGAWFDLARVDSLCMALCLGALLAARWAKTRRALLLAAILSFLAFFTKQAALAIVPGIALSVLLLRGFRSALEYAVATAALVALSVLYLHERSEGWSTYYMFLVPSAHPPDEVQYLNFWKSEFFAEVPIGLVFGLYFALAPGDDASRERRSGLLPFAAIVMAMAYAVRVHSGSFLNDKMPLHAAVALLVGAGLDAAVRGEARGRTRRAAFAYSAVFCQLLFLFYPAQGYIPTRRDSLEGRALLAFAEGFPGDVLFTQHGHLARKIGKPSAAHGMATFDIQRMLKDPRDARRIVESSYEQALASHRFSAIFTDDGLVLQHLVDRYYQAAPFPHNDRLLVPKTGPTYRPRQLYVPRR